MDWNELDVHLSCASDLCLGVVAHFDACLSVGYDDVTSYVWLGLNALSQYAVMTAALNYIAPDVGGAAGTAIVARKSDAVFVHFYDFVVQDKRRVIKQLYAGVAQIYFIIADLNSIILSRKTYISIDIKVRLNGSRPAKEQFVFDNIGPRRLALDVDAVCATCHDVALFN